jgi:hypothetical protein
MEFNPMEDDASKGAAAWNIAIIVLGMIALGAFAYSFVLYSAFSTELAAARSDSKRAHDEVVNLRAQLKAAEAQVEAEQEKLQSAEALIAAHSRRALPIQLSFHDNVHRPGKLAILHNLAGADLELMLEVHSPASGEQVRRPLVINAHGMIEIGAAQGWQFAPGQIVTLENDRYRPLVRVVS